MSVDRFTSSGSVLRNSRNTERWHRSASGGTTPNVDDVARGLLAQVLAAPGSTPDIQPNDGISADGKQWQNQTLVAIPVPNPATEANMLLAGFTDVTQGGGASELNTVGPWTGIAVAGDKFGLDPATGSRYYVDDTGTWQAQSGDLNTTHEVVAGNAPAENTIPTQVSGQTRDIGDYHVITFDDYKVAYRFPDEEITRQSMIEGGFEQVLLTAAGALTPHPKSGWLREYTLTAETPLINIDVEGVLTDVVSNPIAPPTVDGQRIDIIRQSTALQLLNGTVNGITDGVALNLSARKVQLTAIGGQWVTSY